MQRHRAVTKFLLITSNAIGSNLSTGRVTQYYSEDDLIVQKGDLTFYKYLLHGDIRAEYSQ